MCVREREREREREGQGGDVVYITGIELEGLGALMGPKCQRVPQNSFRIQLALCRKKGEKKENV